MFAGQVAKGEDPAAKRREDKRQEREEAKRRARAHDPTLRALLAADGLYQRDLEARAIVNRKVIMRGFNRGLAKLMGRGVADLTRADFVGAINAIKEDGRPGAAQDLRKFARSLCEWLVNEGRITANPLVGLRKPRRSRKEMLAAAAAGNAGRALSDDEILKLWQAAGDCGSFGGLIRLALLTAMRRSELARLERAHDLLGDRIVVMPEHAKTGVQHEVPLTDLMRQLTDAQLVTTSPLVFPSSKTGGRIQSWTKLVTKLQQASGVDFRLHDLRRTCRTLMSQLGVAEDITELAIGHLRADLVRRCNKDQAWPGRIDAFERCRLISLA